VATAESSIVAYRRPLPPVRARFPAPAILIPCSVE
jgi:hypothetical protein